VSKSILLVDEDPEVLTFLTLMFELRGFRALRARTKREALELAARSYVPVDLVLANIMMAHIAGTRFEEQVAHLRGPIPVIYMAAFIDTGLIRVEAMQRPDLSGSTAADERGVVTAVIAALENGKARGTAN